MTGLTHEDEVEAWEDAQEWTEEEELVDEIRNALIEAWLPVTADGSPSFDEMTAAVWYEIVPLLYDRVRSAVEYGIDQTNDSQGPNFEWMAQLIYDKFFKGEK